MSWLRGVPRLFRRCPPPWKLTRAVSEPSSDPAVAEHLRTCRRCSSRHNEFRQLVALAGSLPPLPALAPKARDAIAAQLWVAPPRQPPASRWANGKTVWVAGAIPVAALVALALVTVGRGPRPERQPANVARPSPQSLASIHAFGHVAFARIQAPPDEILRLEEGRIALDITPLRATERFRVLTDDAVVEVRGTSFELSAREGHLLTASVSRGRVEVKTGGALAVLDAGDKWERAATTASPLVVATPPGVLATPPVVVAAPPVIETARPPSAPEKAAPGGARARPGQPPPASPTGGASAGEKAMFARAWSLLRSGDTKAAAVAFAELDERARGRSIEEDALYWRAVAVARLNDEAAAARLFGDFLTRFPRSGHHGEAATALGWLFLRAGNIDGARQAFDKAAGDPSPVVRSSALEGLRRTKHD